MRGCGSESRCGGLILFFGGIETIMPFDFGPGVDLPMFKGDLGFSGECVVRRVEVERSGAPLVWAR